ncbi:MAG: UPF0280 family protein [candidate division WOR-3 bacterium]
MKPYRGRVSGWRHAIRIVYRHSDILLLSEEPIPSGPACERLKELWSELEGYIARHPIFKMSLEPVDPSPPVPDIVAKMCSAAEAAGVGPMAGVAGAFAEEICQAYEGDMAIENGGDVFIRTGEERVAEAFIGNPKLPSLRLVIPPGRWGIATSSGRLGPSLSLGNAWAATVVAESGALADAWATRLGNELGPGVPVREAMEAIKGQDGVLGAILAGDTEIAAWGLRLAQ